MSNKYGIPKDDEEEIRARDKTCIYCHISMKGFPHAMGPSGATIEHLNNDGSFDKKHNIAICCRSCNSSRGEKKLMDWFKSLYCIERNINEKTVAKPVKEYIRSEKRP